jgi:hypothetical protein
MQALEATKPEKSLSTGLHEASATPDVEIRAGCTSIRPLAATTRYLQLPVECDVTTHCAATSSSCSSKTIPYTSRRSPLLLYHYALSIYPVFAVQFPLEFLFSSVLGQRRFRVTPLGVQRASVTAESHYPTSWTGPARRQRPLIQPSTNLSQYGLGLVVVTLTGAF